MIPITEWARRPGVAWVAVGVAAVIFCLPLWLHSVETSGGSDDGGRRITLRRGLPEGHDLAFAYVAADSFSRTMAEGFAYPRWVDAINHGYGAPVFLFYPPLPFHATGLLRLVFGIELVTAFKIVAFLASIGAGISCFWWLRDGCGRGPALLGALLFVVLPYRALDLYERFAFASYLGFLWLPLVFCCTGRVLERPTFRAWLGLVAAFSGLILTHLVTALLSLFLLAPYAVAQLVHKRRLRRVGWLALAGLAAGACCAIYLLPLVAERPSVHLEWIVESPHGDWQRNFVYRDEVAHGFTPAVIKPLVTRATTAQAVPMLAALLLIVGARRRPRGEQRFEPILFGALALWLLVLQTALSAPLWRFAPGLGTVQFPWRFGGLQGLVACWLVAWLARRVFDRPTIGGVLVLGAVTLPMLVVSASLLRADRADAFADPGRLQEAPRLVVKEYIPHGVVGWSRFEQVVPLDQPPATAAGSESIVVKQWQSQRRALDVSLTAPSTLTLRTFAFAGWRAWADGEELPVRAEGPWRRLAVDLPAGLHEVRFTFSATRDRIAGATLTVLSLVTLLAALMTAGVVERRRRRTAPAEPQST